MRTGELNPVPPGYEPGELPVLQMRDCGDGAASTELNLRHLPYKRSALPTELWRRGGSGGARTRDTLLAGQVLSHLSYTPIYDWHLTDGVRQPLPVRALLAGPCGRQMPCVNGPHRRIRTSDRLLPGQVLYLTELCAGCSCGLLRFCQQPIAYKPCRFPESVGRLLPIVLDHVTLLPQFGDPARQVDDAQAVECSHCGERTLAHPRDDLVLLACGHGSTDWLNVFSSGSSAAQRPGEPLRLSPSQRTWSAVHPAIARLRLT